ncbi:hypothetical protein BVRB_3g070290 [Beta vulgaris subsp. vulgaris]|uniref:Uncharacterized protein n=2 Tax=Beta vulgaris TaxID=161934 RepID=A0A0J8BCM4_BETVV|nr:hypothetical protein BVRB_3g070290 [Beta vulgaris subsp. vulgaris]
MESQRGRPKDPQENVDSPGSGGSGKRTRVDGSDSMPETPTSAEGGEDDPRPYGTKKAKAKLKGVAGQTIECFATFNERLRIHAEGRSVDVEIENRKMEVQARKVAAKEAENSVANQDAESARVS